MSQGPQFPQDPIEEGDYTTSASNQIIPSGEIEEAVEHALRYLDDPDTLPTVDLPPAARLLLRSVTAGRDDDTGFASVVPPHSADLEPPPLEQDSLAVALGLVPTLQTNLVGAQLKRARQRSGLKPSQLAARLSNAGYDVTSGDLLRWETATVVPVPSNLLAALAELLGMQASSFGDSAAPRVSQSLAASRQFRELVRRWAAKTNQTLAAAQTALMRDVVSTVRRGPGDSDDIVIAALRIYVEAHDQ